jgi:U4/U6.U5 tri-snRNP-associated protein 1
LFLTFFQSCREREAAELRKRLEESKERRELRAKLEGKTLADVDKEKEGELLSAADWVKRSRIKAKEESEIEKAKRLAELNAKRLQEEEDELLSSSGKAYTSADLKGLQVMHGVKDFEEGQEVILTLADSNILETGEHGKVLGLKEEGDILENVNMTEAQKRIEREKRFVVNVLKRR